MDTAIEIFLDRLKEMDEDVVYSVLKQSMVSYDFDYIYFYIPDRLKILEETVCSRADVWLPVLEKVMNVKNIRYKLEFFNTDINKHISDLNKGTTEALFIFHNYMIKDSELPRYIESYLIKHAHRVTMDFLLGFFSTISEITGSHMMVNIVKSSGDYSDEFNGMDSELWFNLFDHVKSEFKEVLDSRVSPYIFPSRYALYFNFDAVNSREVLRKEAETQKRKPLS